MELLNTDDVGTVITVVGARGGIGKSTIATNLAAAIASNADRSVLVMDMDTGYGNVALMLNVKPRTTITEIAACRDLTESTLRAGLQRHESGAFVLGAPDGPGPWARVTATQVQELLQFSARFFDYVVVDTSGIFTDIVAAAMGVADRVIVVNSLDMASTRQTSQMFELLEAEQFDTERLYLVVNQVNTAITIRPEDVQGIVGQPVFWTIPYDQEVPASHSVGRPVVLAQPGSSAAQQLLGLARRVTANEGDDQDNAAQTPSRLARIVPWPWRNRQAQGGETDSIVAQRLTRLSPREGRAASGESRFRGGR
jgi:pilus assembly protein CpaE